MSDPDVLIVGAGPAGATAAILLAQQGARVTLVDKARFPRDKLCGEFVSPEAVRILERTGILPELSRMAGRASHVLLTDQAARTARLPLPQTPPVRQEALGIPRREMDAALLARAAAKGVRVIEGFEVRRALVAEGRAGGVAGSVRGGTTEERISARFVIAADGRDSALAWALAPKEIRVRSSPKFGLKAHYRNVAGFGGAVELHYFRGGYVGMHDVGGGIVNICALLDRAVTGPIPRTPEKIVTEIFFQNSAARARFEGAERVSEWLAVGSLSFRVEAPVRTGVFFLGDAAGTIDPFAGEGMSMAFRSAEIAAEEIAAALGSAGKATRARTGLQATRIPAAPAFHDRDGDGDADAPRTSVLRPDDAALAAYARRWRKEFAHRIAFCRAIGRLAVYPAAQTGGVVLLRAFPIAGTWLARGTRAGIDLRRPGGASV